MHAPTLSEDLQVTSAYVAHLKSRITQLEEAVYQLYQAISPICGTIDFSQLSPRDFATPYSTHSVAIPGTKLSVTFITTPPHLVIGTPNSHKPGALKWEHALKIEFPLHTTFIAFSYGGEAGAVQWFSTDGAEYQAPALSALSATDPIEHFYLAQHEGISNIQISGTGKMFLTTLTVGISARA